MNVNGQQLCLDCGVPVIASGNVQKSTTRYCNRCLLKKLQSDKLFKKEFVNLMVELSENEQIQKRLRYLKKLKKVI
jgi:hypothetical protein